MKVHSTNYTNTFIEVAEDCPSESGEIPPEGKQKSVANLQYEILVNHPYKYTSDDVIFTVFAIKKDLPEETWEEERIRFFAKGQPCFRASPLTKRYGWGIYSDQHGKIALYARESPEYEEFINNASVAKVKAMRSKRK